MRVTGLRTVPQLVDLAFSHGAKTIVAVGSDETLHDVINAVRGREIIIGFIPLFDTELSKVMGLPNIETAAKVLASRRISQLDLGVVNQFYFLSKLSFGVNVDGNIGNIFSFGSINKLLTAPVIEIKFKADGSYEGSLAVIGGVIVNTRNQDHDSMSLGPTDSVLDVILVPGLSRLKILKQRKNLASGLFEKIEGASVLHLKKLKIESPEGLALRIEGRVVTKTPATIEVAPKALKMIVGKDRLF